MKSFFALLLGASLILTMILVNYDLHVFSNSYTYKGIYDVPTSEAYALQDKYGLTSVDIICTNANDTTISIDIDTKDGNIASIGTPTIDTLIKIFSFAFLSIGVIVLISGAIGMGISIHRG